MGIAAYVQGANGEPLLSVTGETIQAWLRSGPGSEEFSEALGMVALSSSLRLRASGSMCDVSGWSSGGAHAALPCRPCAQGSLSGLP